METWCQLVFFPIWTICILVCWVFQWPRRSPSTLLGKLLLWKETTSPSPTLMEWMGGIGSAFLKTVSYYQEVSHFLLKWMGWCASSTGLSKEWQYSQMWRAGWWHDFCSVDCDCYLWVEWAVATCFSWLVGLVGCLQSMPVRYIQWKVTMAYSVSWCQGMLQ